MCYILSGRLGEEISLFYRNFLVIQPQNARAGDYEKKFFLLRVAVIFGTVCIRGNGIHVDIYFPAPGGSTQ